MHPYMNQILAHYHFFLFLYSSILASSVSMSTSPTYWAALSSSRFVSSFPILFR